MTAADRTQTTYSTYTREIESVFLDRLHQFLRPQLTSFSLCGVYMSTHTLSLSLKYLSQHSELFLSHAEEKIRRHHHPPSSYHSSDKSSRPHRGHSHITCRIRRRRSSIHSVRQRHRSIRQRSSHLLLLLLSLPLFFLPLSLSLSAPPPPSSLPRRVASLAFCSSVDCAAKPLGLGREPVP